MRAERHAGRTGAHIVIGDGPKTDIPGAEAAGIDAVISGGLAGAVQKLDTAEQIAAVLKQKTPARWPLCAILSGNSYLDRTSHEQRVEPLSQFKSPARFGARQSVGDW